MKRLYLRLNLVYWVKHHERDSYTCILESNIKEWLEENIEKSFKFDYSYIATPDEFTCYIDPRDILKMGLIDPYIDFESTADAVLFKLQWL